MNGLIAFLVTWWYCYDDHLAAWTGQSWVGTVWLIFWIGMWFATAFTYANTDRE